MRTHLPKLALCFQCVILMLSLSACGGGGGGGSSPAPSAITMGANPVTNENAVLLGDVNPNGQDTTAWFEYGADNTLSVFSKTADQAIGSGTVEVPIQATIQNLNAGAAYYFRVAASNAAGTRKGTIAAFNAALLPPAANTAPAQPVNNDNAVLNGVVNPRGLATTAWYEWGTDPTLNGRTSTAAQPVGPGTADVALHVAVAGLTPGTTYYFRIVGQNTVGITRGPIVSFKASQIPVAISNAATNVTAVEATLNGSINPNGLQTNYWFLWGTDPALPVSATTHATPMQQIPAGLSNAQAVTADLTGLSIGVTYYFRIVASNADGEASGDIRNFTTPTSPTVATLGAASITTTGATLSGEVNPNGDATDAWFEYGTDPALSSFSSTTQVPKGSGTTTLAFNASISGLSSWRTYYYRAAASNGGGTQKGAIASFPTGDYYVAFGDSITAGSGDDIPGDDTSLDGRNTGGGFEPILNNLLTAAKGYPHTVVKEGYSGYASADGLSIVNSVLSGNSSAKFFLVQFGTNDAFIPAVSKAAYKSNMQGIITAIKNAGKIPYLAKVPYTTDGASYSLLSIQDYNAAIDELVSENGISVTPPDFYALFQNTSLLSADGLHPNGTGYQSMANSWFNALP